VNEPASTPFSNEVADCAADLRRGDLSALGRLFDLTSARLVRYGKALTRNQADAEDALQAALVRVAVHPQLLANARLPWPYFLQIVRNEALKIVQRKQPLQSLEALFEQWTVDDADAEREESAARVRAALQRLPAEQAEVVVLRMWEEMTFAEIALVIGESANTIASRYRYALQKLTRYLQPSDSEVPYE
jgi:RNA polymerase sigma-70 factor (ECF subfamily)